MALTKARISQMVRHPLFLLVAGTALGSVIIPGLTTLAASSKLRQEALQQIALEVLQKGFDVDRDFNAVKTHIDAFIDRQRQAHDALASAKADVRAKFDDFYQEFNKVAWWWASQEYDKARVLDLLSAGQLRDFESLKECYRMNLVVSTGEVSAVRDLSLLGTFGDEMLRTARERHERLDRLDFDRDQLVLDMAHLFTGQRPAIADDSRMNIEPGWWEVRRSKETQASSGNELLCWNPGDVENARRVARKIEGGGSKCTINDLEASHGWLSWNATCGDGSRSSARTILCGSIYRATITRSGGRGSPAATRVTEQVTGERIGDCDQAGKRSASGPAR
ncbi:MAG TPA: DUF3617 family protein [Thermoanaerobaculia bacterium]|nr:DUF3617 family protein [Thermoanaerobaculia bacterium]